MVDELLGRLLGGGKQQRIGQHSDEQADREADGQRRLVESIGKRLRLHQQLLGDLGRLAQQVGRLGHQVGGRLRWWWFFSGGRKTRKDYFGFV